jgi:hypothetical protein
LGILIALLTLTLPLFVVSHFSTTTADLKTPPAFTVPASTER